MLFDLDYPDKLAVQFLATIKLAMIRQHLKAFPDRA